jgi:hypothetical protein
LKNISCVVDCGIWLFTNEQWYTRKKRQKTKYNRQTITWLFQLSEFCGQHFCKYIQIYQ